MSRIRELQEAARKIEIDGAEAYHTVRRMVGEDIARVLLIAHLRRQLGSMKSYPPDPDIDGRVEEMLQEMGIL